MTTTWTFNDGGREAAGYTGKTGDCGVRALAIVTGRPYQEVYDAVNAAAANERPRAKAGRNRGKRSSARDGIFMATYKKVCEAFGLVWVPTMGIGTGCRVHLKAAELPTGRIIARVSKHYAAVVDGVIQDIYDPSRAGTRCVYGYFKLAADGYAAAHPNALDRKAELTRLAQEN